MSLGLQGVLTVLKIFLTPLYSFFGHQLDLVDMSLASDSKHFLKTFYSHIILGTME